MGIGYQWVSALVEARLTNNLAYSFEAQTRHAAEINTCVYALCNLACELQTCVDAFALLNQ